MQPANSWKMHAQLLQLLQRRAKRRKKASRKCSNSSSWPKRGVSGIGYNQSKGCAMRSNKSSSCNKSKHLLPAMMMLVTALVQLAGRRPR